MRWSQSDVDVFLARTKGSMPIAAPAPSQAARKQKFGNRKFVDAKGLKHDSKKEYRRWRELEVRERVGEIHRLRRQVAFALVVNGILICQYIADFVYDEGKTSVVEDCKSEPTRKLAAYRIKRKLMAAIHNIEVREI